MIHDPPPTHHTHTRTHTSAHSRDTRTYPTHHHQPTETGRQHCPTPPPSPQGPEPGVVGTITTDHPSTGDRENPHPETPLTREQQAAPTEPPQATGSHRYPRSAKSMTNHMHTQPPSPERKPQLKPHNAPEGPKAPQPPLPTGTSRDTTADIPEQRETPPPRHPLPTRTHY